MGNKRKTFLLALLALTSSIIGAAHAQVEEKQCQEGQTMDACRDYLKQQCTASAMPITWPWKWRMSSCRRLRLRCCEQLEQMPPSCRCRAIRSTVEELQRGGLPGSDHHQMMSKVMEMAKTLPSICNMDPSYCSSIPTTGTRNCRSPYVM
ncbi:hordoindoline-A-like [Setaria viridis]|uniref:Bifunctional inhibitor/plant lipid transfer protein/seed storage helical domain-containing protein n=1 Tax=Setaria viridis TaxID=4556 RepID=A0A4U6VJR9_SETVI|nr:hypothetical protein SEVIR_3G425600v2 [Setaria viridis]